MKKSAKVTQPAAVKTSNNSSQSTAPVVIPAPHKQQTAKEAIAANVQLLIEQLEQGHSEGLTAYLTAMGRFHRYSFGNILEIARQKSDATRVAGMYAWNQLGRRVKKGEKGIRILAPVNGIRRKNDAEADRNKVQDIRTQNQPVLVGFRSAWVWDISSTEGRDLPELSCEVTGSVGVYRERLMDFVIAQGITLEFKDSIAPALGMCYGDRIVLLPGQSPAEEFNTLVHELAHSFLHRAERRITTTKTVRETEAEAIAFVVGTTIGLDTGNASASYIQLYHGNAALLAESLEVIQKTSAVILSALETHAAEPAAESEPEASQPAATERDGAGRTEATDILKKTAPRASVLAHTPRFTTVEQLIRLKKIWAVSVAALAYRFHTLKILSDWHYRTIYVELSKRGYTKREPESEPHETSQLLAKAFSALREEGITRQQVARDICVHTTELDDLLLGLSFGRVDGGRKLGPREPSKKTGLVRVK